MKKNILSWSYAVHIIIGMIIVAIIIETTYAAYTGGANVAICVFIVFLPLLTFIALNKTDKSVSNRNTDDPIEIEPNVLVDYLIENTKGGKITWQLYQPDKTSTPYPAYFISLGIGKNVIVVTKHYNEKYKTYESVLIIRHKNEYNHVMSCIYPHDLSKDNCLAELYHLIERQVNYVDDIMEDFVEGIA